MNNPEKTGYVPAEGEVTLGPLTCDLVFMHRDGVVGVGFVPELLDKLTQIPPEQSAILVYDPWLAMSMAMALMSHAASCDEDIRALVETMSTHGEVWLKDHEKAKVKDAEG